MSGPFRVRCCPFVTPFRKGAVLARTAESLRKERRETSREMESTGGCMVTGSYEEMRARVEIKSPKGSMHLVFLDVFLFQTELLGRVQHQHLHAYVSRNIA